MLPIGFQQLIFCFFYNINKFFKSDKINIKKKNKKFIHHKVQKNKKKIKRNVSIENIINYTCEERE